MRMGRCGVVGGGGDFSKCETLPFLSKNSSDNLLNTPPPPSLMFRLTKRCESISGEVAYFISEYFVVSNTAQHTVALKARQ